MLQRRRQLDERWHPQTVQYGRVKTISDEEIERFRKTYITVQEMRKIIGRPSSVLGELDRAGIKPVCARPEFHQVLYEREAVMAIMREIMARSGVGKQAAA